MPVRVVNVFVLLFIFAQVIRIPARVVLGGYIILSNILPALAIPLLLGRGRTIVERRGRSCQFTWAKSVTSPYAALGNEGDQVSPRALWRRCTSTDLGSSNAR